MPILSNVEFMLLQIISEKAGISGYEINRLVEERGFREWADIGTTSIYVGLDKLQKKELLDAYMDTAKQGKGPIPKKFKINKKGLRQLKNEIVEALSNTRERDHRFDLGIAAIPLLSKEEAVIALEKRKQYLSQKSNEIEAKFISQGSEKLPLNVQMLFDHPRYLIKYEIEFTNSLITKLMGKG